MRPDGISRRSRSPRRSVRGASPWVYRGTSTPSNAASSGGVRAAGACRPALVLVACVLSAACSSGAAPRGGGGRPLESPGAPAAAPVERQAYEIVWQRLGSWSGRGSIQTESFQSDTGYLRLSWTTSGETAPGAGAFRLAVHSAISGRPLAVAADQRGAGSDSAYVHEDPRVFYAVVDSSGLEWTFTVEEGRPARRVVEGR